MPQRLEAYWARTGAGLDELIAREANHEVEDLLQHTIAFMAFTIEDLQARATQYRNLLGTLDSLAVLAFDAVRSAHQAQRILSLAGTALAARTCFEACCTMRFITEAGAEAPTYASRYARWMHVETLEYHRRVGEPLPWDEFIRHAQQASEWLEPDSFEVRERPHWANAPRFGNLFVIAQHLGLERDYRQIYGAGSAFVHASSTASRLYRVGQGLRPVADQVHVSRFGTLAASLALRLHRAFLAFHGVGDDGEELVALLARTAAAAETLGA